MTRIRTIKPEFWSDEKVSVLNPIDRLVFLGLISMADDYGRVHDNVKVMDAFIFPETSDSVRESVANLSRIGRVVRGKSSSGMRIMQIVNWTKHQRVDKPQPNKALPPIHETIEESSENLGKQAIRESFANHSGTIPEQFQNNSCLLPPTSDHLPPTTDHSLSVSETENGRCDYSADFEKFWEVYPKQRRTKKQEAFRKWKHALKRVDAKLLIQRASDYANSEQGRSEYAVMPSVWLNGGMWQDEPEAWGRGKNQVLEVPF